jgi:small subunit ribosomal protein S6
MFLLDNQVVRADWGRAKSVITDTLQKHGAKVVSARRWDERKLAYPIQGRRRATYLLSYFEIGGQGVNAMRRDLELDERVLRYLIVSAPALPEGELDKSQAELAEGFSVPPPPDEEVSSREQAEFGQYGEHQQPAAPAAEEPAAEPEAAPQAEASPATSNASPSTPQA